MSVKLEDLDTEKVYQAIKEGVSEALSYALGSDCTHNFFTAIQTGVEEAVGQCHREEFFGAVSEGVRIATKEGQENEQ